MSVRVPLSETVMMNGTQLVAPIDRGKKDPVGSKPTERVFQIIDLLTAEDGLSFTEVADRSDLFRSSAIVVSRPWKIRSTLSNNGKYYPAMRFFKFGEYVGTRTDVHGMIELNVEFRDQ